MITLRPHPPQKELDSLGPFPRVVSELLWHRGIRTVESARKFLYPEKGDLYPPVLLPGVREVRSLMKKLARERKPVVIVGDYDTDGITAAAMLAELFASLRHPQVRVVLPNRYGKAAYGLSDQLAEECAAQGAGAVFTVDCGMSSVSAMRALRSRGIEVVIIDHHQEVQALPEDVLVINPHRKGNSYPFPDLSACGLVFKLSHALLGRVDDYHMVLAAIAAIADKVPLQDENRVLTRLGSFALASTRRAGLAELVRISGNNLSAVGQRINSVRPLGTANNAYELLRTRSREKARRLAKELDGEYRRRELSLKESVRLARVRTQGEESAIAIVDDETVFPELRGAVAGRLAAALRKPAFVYGTSRGMVRGSARSSGEADLVKMLGGCEAHLEEYGGHPKAAGFALRTEQLAGFRQCVLDQGSRLVPASAKRVFEADAVVDSVDRRALEYLEMFKPYGMENNPPVLIYNIFAPKKTSASG